MATLLVVSVVLLDLGYAGYRFVKDFPDENDCDE